MIHTFCGTVQIKKESYISDKTTRGRYQ